jgi:alkaline phosphatase
MIPVYAYGPGAQEFTGIYENTDIFRKIVAAFGFDNSTP